jgi:hypothetical protein
MITVSLIRIPVLLALMASCLAAPRNIEVPKATWEPIYFEAIDALSKKVGWKALRKVDIGDGAIEVRVWMGFGGSLLEGFRIRREGSRWSGFHVTDGFDKRQPLRGVREVRPRSNWDALWRKVEVLGILTLPDKSALPDEVLVRDGMSYVVEINEGAHYRTYLYCNPQEQKWPEAKKIMEIVNVLNAEFILNKKDA